LLVVTNLMSKLDKGADNESDKESIKENGRPPKGVTMVEDKVESPIAETVEIAEVENAKTVEASEEVEPTPKKRLLAKRLHQSQR